MIVTRDENFNLRASFWSDLHGVLYDALPPDIFYWGHQFLSFNTISGDKTSVKMKAKVLRTDEIVEVGNSVTMKVSSDMIQKMQQEAEKVLVPELARVMKETKEPFLNVVYDCDPLHQIFWDNVVLIGDAAHPTTPHGLRSTNMSILDAAVLGNCLDKWRVEKLSLALEEYQSFRVPVTSKQVLHSRRMGRSKQGFVVASPEDCQELQQKNMPFFR